MKSVAMVAGFVLVIGVGAVSAQEKVVIGGAGSMIPIAQEVAKAYQSKHPTQQVEVVPNSLGSTGGIKATEAGRLTLGLTGRALRPEEKGKLVHRLIGRMIVAFSVRPEVSVSSLRESQICDIYAGKVKSWKEVGGVDGKIMVLTRNEDDGAKEAVRTKLPCFKGLQESAEAIVLTSSSAMMEASSGRPSTIGLVDFSVVANAQGRIKAVAIDGVAPSSDSVRSGKYKLYKEFGVVTLGEPQGATKRFLEFMVGQEGEPILSQNGVVFVQ